MDAFARSARHGGRGAVLIALLAWTVPLTAAPATRDAGSERVDPGCVVAFGQGWHGVERSANGWHRWSSGRGQLALIATRAMTVELSGLVLSASQPNEVELRLDESVLATVRVAEGNLDAVVLGPVRLRVDRGEHWLGFDSRAEGRPTAGDPRVLAAGLANLRVVNVETGIGCRVDQRDGSAGSATAAAPAGPPVVPPAPSRLPSPAVMLPVAAFCLLLVAARTPGAGIGDSVLKAATSFGLVTVALTEGLGLAGRLGPRGLAAGWVVVSLAAAAAALGRRHLRRSAGPAPPAADGQAGATPLSVSERVTVWVSAGGIVVLMSASLASALLYPPNTWDAMTYHLPRVVHWLQNRSLEPFAVSFRPEIRWGPGAEYLVLQFHALARTDLLDALVQWLALLGSVAGARAVARELNAGRVGQALAGLGVVAIPQGILYASAVKNDHVLAFWLVSLTYFLLRFRRQPSSASALWISAPLALALLTKATGYLLAPAVLVTAITGWPRRTVLALLAWAPAAALVVLAVNGPMYARNIGVYGTPFGASSEGAEGSFDYTIPGLKPSDVASNALRNLALQMVTPFPSVNAAVERGARAAVRAIGADPDDPRTTWTGSTFAIPPFNRHEAAAANPVNLILVAATVVVAFTRRRLRSMPGLPGALLAPLLGALLFCGAVRWQPWHTRLHLPLFLLAAAPAAVVVSALDRRLAAVTSVVLVAVAVPFAVNNQLRPLPNARAAAPESTRWDGYFADRPLMRQPYRDGLAVIAESGCTRIGLDLGGNGYEYPLMAAFAGRRPAVVFEHVNVGNETGRLARPGFDPCAIFCTGCSPASPRRASYVRAGLVPTTIGAGVVVLVRPVE